jgi:hypothetical protein
MTYRNLLFLLSEKITTVEDQFKLTWEIPDTVNCYTTLSGYNIYRNFQLIDTLPSDSLSYLEEGPPLMGRRSNILLYYGDLYQS